MDIRMSRKSNPVTTSMNLRKSAIKTKSSAPLAKKANLKKSLPKNIKALKPVKKEEIPIELPQKRGRPSKPLKVVNKKYVKLEPKVKIEPAKTSNLKNKKVVNSTEAGETDDKRRRRRDTEDYIKRRFLYDVPEPPKRARRKRTHSGSEAAAASTTGLSGKRARSSAGSAMALLAASAANLLNKKKEQQQKKKRAVEAKALNLLEGDGDRLSSDDNEPGMLTIDEDVARVNRASKYRSKIERKKDKKRLNKRPHQKDRFIGKLRDTMSGDELDVSGSDQSDFFVQSNLITTGSQISDRRISGAGIRCKTSSGMRRRDHDLGSDLGLDVKSSRPSASEDEFACYGAGSDIVEDDDDEDFSGELLSPSVLVHGASPLEHGYAAAGGMSGLGGASAPGAVAGVSRRKSPIRPMLVLPTEVTGERNRRQRPYRGNTSPFVTTHRHHNYHQHHHHHRHPSGGGVSAQGVVLSVSPDSIGSPARVSPGGGGDHLGLVGTGSLSPTSPLPPGGDLLTGGGVNEVDEAVRRIMRTEKMKGPNRPMINRRSGSGPPSSQPAVPVKPAPRPAQPPGPRRRPSILQRKSTAAIQTTTQGGIIATAITTTTTQQPLLNTNTSSGVNQQSIGVSSVAMVTSGHDSTTTSAVCTSAPVTVTVVSSVQQQQSSHPLLVQSQGARQRLMHHVGGGQQQQQHHGSLTASAKLFGKKSGYEASSATFSSLVGLPSSTHSGSADHGPTFLTPGAQVVGTNGMPLVLQKGTAVQYAMVRGTADGKSYVLVGGQGGAQQGGNRPSIVRTNARSLLRTTTPSSSVVGGVGGESIGGVGSNVLMVRGHDGITRMMPTATSLSIPTSGASGVETVAIE